MKWIKYIINNFDFEIKSTEDGLKIAISSKGDSKDKLTMNVAIQK